MRRAVWFTLVLLSSGCPTGEAPKDAPPPKAAQPKQTIDDAKAGAERAVQAGDARNEQALDRAMQGEAPAGRSPPR